MLNISSFTCAFEHGTTIRIIVINNKVFQNKLIPLIFLYGFFLFVSLRVSPKCTLRKLLYLVTVNVAINVL